jgi:hypothetical protein
VSGAPPDSVQCTRALEAELFTFGNFQGHSAIIHRTVRCTPDFPVCQRSNGYFARNGRLQPHSMRYSARQSQSTRLAHRTIYRTCLVHHRTAQRPHKSELQRSNPNGLLTWLAHRTVSGGAPDCPVRHATAVFQQPFLVVGAIHTPTTPHSMTSKFSTLLYLTRSSIQYKTHQSDQILFQLHTKL